MLGIQLNNIESSNEADKELTSFFDLLTIITFPAKK